MHRVLRAGCTALLLLLAVAPAAVAGLAPDEERLLGQLDATRTLADLEQLSEGGGSRTTGLGVGTIVSGSAEEAAAAQRLAGRLRAMGLDVAIEAFPVRAFRYGPVTLTANGTPVAAISLHATGGSWGVRDGVPYARGDDGGRVVRAALVDAGDGYEADYARIGSVRGKIVLVRRDSRDWPPAQVTEAAQHGAKGILFFDHPSAEQHPDALRQDSLWGHDQLPTVAISRGAGDALRSQLAAGPVEASLEVRQEVADGRSHNVVARLRGSERPGEYVVVSAHYDRWFTGAADNTSGVAAVLEIARAFTRSGLKPRRTVLFILAGSEEAGLEDPERDWLAGSNAFLNQHPDVMRQAALVFNVDLLGGTSATASLSSSADVLASQAVVLHDLGLAGRITQKPTFGSSIDAWNFGVVGGAATNHLNRIPDDYFSIYHTQVDAYRPGAFNNMRDDLRLLTLSLWRASRDARLPIALTSVADLVETGAAKDSANAPGVSFAALHDALVAFRSAAATVEGLQQPARVDDLNRLLMATRHDLVPWLYASDDDFEQATRTALPATRVAALARAEAAARRGDRDGAVAALKELYEGRQCMRLAPPVYELERSFWSSDGGWASRFQHRAPPPPPSFEAACALLLRPTPDTEQFAAAAVRLREHAEQQVAEAAALMTGHLRAATARLLEFGSSVPAAGSVAGGRR